MTKLRVIVASLLIFSMAASKTMAYCFEEAGELYNISPVLLWGIAKGESGFDPGAINRNRNGSYDFGLMQINSFWAKTLGPSLWGQLGDPCTNVKVGAWVLAQCMQRFGYTWEAVGCYNAASKSKRATYAQRIYSILTKAGVYAPAKKD